MHFSIMLCLVIGVANSLPNEKGNFQIEIFPCNDWLSIIQPKTLRWFPSTSRLGWATMPPSASMIGAFLVMETVLADAAVGWADVPAMSTLREMVRINLWFSKYHLNIFQLKNPWFPRISTRARNIRFAYPVRECAIAAAAVGSVFALAECEKSFLQMKLCIELLFELSIDLKFKIFGEILN